MYKLLAALCLLLYTVTTRGQSSGDSGSYQNYEEVYSWITVDYDWENDSMKQTFLEANKFIPGNNSPTGIKVYGEDVYVSVSRWFDGVPSTLNKVVMKSGKPILQPFPSWDMQTIGDCKAFQFVQAVEIDPNTGWLWAVDTGRSGFFSPNPLNSCPAKLVIYDLKSGKEVRRYIFPNQTASWTENYLNDIVLDYIDGQAAYAYITDTTKPGLVVYDFKGDSSYRFEDTTMSTEPDSAIFVDGDPFDPLVAINGIAMSPEFKYVYFCPVSGITLYQVPTAVLRNRSAVIGDHIRVVGKKASQGDGMIFSVEGNMYFGGINDSSVYRWNAAEDIKAAPMSDEGRVSLNAVKAILRNMTTLEWVDTFAFDNSGYLWFTSPNNGRRFTGKLNFTQTSTTNFRILKTFVGESSYLTIAKTEPPVVGGRKKGGSDGQNGNKGSGAPCNMSPQALLLTFILGVAFKLIY